MPVKSSKAGASLDVGIGAGLGWTRHCARWVRDRPQGAILRMPQPAEVQIVVGSRIEYLDSLHAMAEEMARLSGLGDEDRFHFALAVREAATNAIVHGNGSDPEKKVTLVFELESGVLEARVSDQGGGFDFDHGDDPTLPENLFRTSGRGLLLIRSFVDEVSYHHDPGRGTELRLVKRLAG